MNLETIYLECYFCDNIRCTCEWIDNTPCFCDSCEYNRIYPLYLINKVRDYNYNIYKRLIALEDIENIIRFHCVSYLNNLEKWLEYNFVEILDSIIFYNNDINIISKNYNSLVEIIQNLLKHTYKFDLLEELELKNVVTILRNLLEKMEKAFRELFAKKCTKKLEKELIERAWHPLRVFKWCLDLEEMKEIKEMEV